MLHDKMNLSSAKTVLSELHFSTHKSTALPAWRGVTGAAVKKHLSDFMFQQSRR